jgi:SUKH-4 immunity protein
MPPTDEIDPTRLPGWESLPADLQRTFVDARLPSAFLRRHEGSANFVAGPDLREIEAPALGRLVRFGRRIGGLGGDFCVHPESGEVVLAIPDIPPIFVNSSLDALARTIRLVLGFERLFTTGDAETCWTAAEDIRDGVKQIDPPAGHPDHYWGSFASDVEAGDYSNNEDFSCMS